MDFRQAGDLAEYLVNNTLYHMLGARRYRGEEEGDIFLFDGLVLPANPASSRLVEIDHLVVCRKGVIALETKNVGGTVVPKGDYWSVVRGDGRQRQMYSPLLQNRSHLRALEEHFYRDEPPIAGAVVMVSVSEYGWEPADLGGIAPIGVYTSPFDVVEMIRESKDVLDGRAVARLSEQMFFYYKQREKLKRLHLSQVKERRRRWKESRNDGYAPMCT